MLDPGINIAESFKKQKTQQQYNEIYRTFLELHSVLDSSTDKEAGRSFFVSQGGYQGYATEYSPTGSSGAGGSRISDSGKSNKTDTLVPQKLADRLDVALTDRALDFQGDRVREGFKVRRASSSIASWVGFRLHGFSINRSEFTLRAALTDVLIVHVTGVVQFVAH